MPRQVPFVTLDVFTSRLFSGNPLAVVFHPDSSEPALTQAQKQTIAQEFNLSETIFVHPGKGSRKRTIDIFTVDKELPFAGHPTIGAASWFLCHSTKQEDEGVDTLATKAGDIPISLHSSVSESPDGAGATAAKTVSARIAHNTRLHTARFPLRELLRLHPSLTPFFQGQEGAEERSFPVFSIVNGMTQVHVELPSLEALAAVTTAAGGEVVNAGASHLLDEGWDSGLTIVYFFVRDVDDPETGMRVIRTRAIIGNLEDPATGSAASGLASYLTLTAGEPGQYQYDILQGVEMGRRSEIGLGVLVGEDRKIERVELKGAAVKVSEGSILVPE